MVIIDKYNGLTSKYHSEATSHQFDSNLIIIHQDMVIIDTYNNGHSANITCRQLLDTTALLELLKWNTPTVS